MLAKAVVEHNLLGTSRLYANISFAALGRLLGLEPEKAEETTVCIIEQDRLLDVSTRSRSTSGSRRARHPGREGLVVPSRLWRRRSVDGTQT